MEAAASIAGLIQLAGAVTAVTYTYMAAVKGAKKEIESLVSELHQLSGVLNQMKMTVDANPESALALACLGTPPPMISNTTAEAREQQEQLELDAAAAATNTTTNGERGGAATKKKRGLGSLLSRGGLKGKGKTRSGDSNNINRTPVPPPQPTKPFDACRDLLQRLDKRLNVAKLQGGTTDRGAATTSGKFSMTKITSSLMWPLEKKETLEHIERMERLKSLFTLAMTADQMTLMDEINTFSKEASDLARENAANLQRLEQAGQEQAEWRRRFEIDRKDSMRSTVLKWLSLVDAEANHRTARNSWQPGTGEWFLRSEVFQMHLQEDDSFIWLHGIPGAGKTVLMSSVISEIQTYCANPGDKSEGYYNLAYFYFDFKDQQKQSVENMVRSLLRQFAEYEKVLPQEIVDLHERFGTQSYIPMHDLKNALGSMMQEFGKTFINVDAMDECTDQEGLIEFIEWLKLECDARVQFMATSRREAAIEDKLVEDLEFITIPIQNDSVDADVCIYVTDMIASDSKLKTLKQDVKDQIIEKLVTGAKGMFRWVKCQLDNIKSCRRPKDILLALEDLPKTLDATYEAALLRIQSKDEELAIRAFRWLVLAFRPLTVEQLAEAVIVEEGDEEISEYNRLSDSREILEICGNLVSVDARTRHVGLAHFSVQEYLLSDRIRKSRASKFAVVPLEAHEYLLSTCLTYLQLDEFDSGPKKRRTMREDRLLKYPIVFYAANNWFNHAKMFPELERQVFERAPKLFGEFAMGGRAGVKRTYCFNSWLQIFTRRPHALKVKKKPPTGVNAKRYRDEIAPSPLFVACALGLTNTADAMIEEGCGGDIDAADKLVGGILTAAVDGGHYDMAEMLLSRGANPRGTDSNGRTSLHRAAKIADDRMIKLLLMNGADPLSKDSAGWNALHTVCSCVSKSFRRGDVEESINALIDAGCEPSDQVPDGRTPLYIAAQSRNADAAWALVTIMQKQKKGHTREADFVPDEASGKTMLHWAAFCGKLDVLRRYLEQPNCDVHATDCLMRTPLHDAVDMGFLDTVDELLVRGKADILRYDHRNHTPIAVAGMRGNLPMLTRLFEDHEQDVDQGQLNQALASSIFARRNLEITRYLLQKGADPNAQRSSIGRTVLQLATQREDWPLIDLLTSFGGRTDLFVSRKWALEQKAIIDGVEDDEKRRSMLRARVGRTNSDMSSGNSLDVESIEGDMSRSIVSLPGIGVVEEDPDDDDDEDEEEEDEAKDQEDVKEEVRAEMKAVAEMAAEVEAQLSLQEDPPPPFEERKEVVRGKKKKFQPDMKVANAYDTNALGNIQHIVR